jgi:hypothetical protein
MNFLAENALAIWMVGAVLVTMAGITVAQLRTRGALLALLAVIVFVGALLVVEHLIETPREAVARTLDELAAAIEANDLPGVLAFIAPTAGEIRKDAETLMPLVVVNKARVLGTPEITVDESAQPLSATATATAKCQGFVDVTVRQNGAKGPYMDRVEIHFVATGDRWLIESYTPARDWRRAASGGLP